MKKVLFIGNRNGCYKVLEDNPNYNIVKILALKNSYLDNYLKSTGCEYEAFTIADKDYVMNVIREMEYDILVSNGCPFILKATELIIQGKILLNTHPTYLPHLRGATPLNGVFYNGYNYLGATTHYISDGIDSGNVIAQIKVDLTEDIDQGLVYFISFDLEGKAFAEALQKLEETDYKYEGTKIDVKEGCYFNRTKEKQTINLLSDNTETIIRKVKSFGIKGQGCTANIEGNDYTIFDASVVVNPYLILKFEQFAIGTIVHKYDEKLIVKTCDGLIKVTRFE